MAAAEIIGTAIGVMLLIIVAYILTGTTLITAETMANAQKDLTLRQETQLRTGFSISTISGKATYFTYSITNDGAEIISDFAHMNVLVRTSDGVYHQCNYNATPDISGTWYFPNYYTDSIHPHELDPGEAFQVRVTISPTANWFQMTTGNGVYDSSVI